MRTLRWVAVLALLVSAPSSASGQVWDHFFPGWFAEIYIHPRGAPGLDFITAMAVLPNGDLYAAELQTFDQPAGRIRLIRDSDGDGLADTEWIYASGFTEPTGLALLPNGDLYVSSAGRITRVRDTDGDEIADDYLDILTGLPGIVPAFNGDHRNHGIAYGPDGFLYTGIGYPNFPPPSDPRQGTIRRISLDGQVDESFAVGIRNVFGIVFNDAGDLFANDQDSNISEEVNHIRLNQDYGFPMYEGTPPAGTGTIGPIAEIPNSPVGMAFGWGGKLYLASHDAGGAIFEITLTPSGPTFTATVEQIQSGSKPMALAFDAVNQRMFMASFSLEGAVIVFEPAAGACSVPGDCDDSNSCTDDDCVNEICEYTANTDPCDVGLGCTVGDVCGGGVCVPGTPVDLLCDDANPCTDHTCSVVTGCNVAFNDDLCNDGASCTFNDICVGGVCTGQDTCGVGFLCNPPLDLCEVDLMVTEEGTQPGLAHPVLDSTDCSGCHADFDVAQHIEPFDTWSGSMMAQATRDPLFWAALDVANHDAPGIGDWCLRCHTPAAWLAGRSEPPGGSVDGCGLIGNIDQVGGDFDGVNCHLCHRMMINPAPPAGQQSFFLENGQFWLDDGDCGGGGEPCRRGPYDYSGGESLPPHPWAASSYVTGSDLCGACHNVTSPLKNLISGGVDTGIPFPIERTHKEWSQSDYAVGGGSASECQSCHMPQAAGGPAYTCNEEQNDRLGDLAIHQFAGGNAWIPQVLSGEYPALGLTAAFNETRDAALAMLQTGSASVELFTNGDPVPGSPYDVDVRVTNLAGHKLPTGYPEGRRMWIQLEAHDAFDQLIWESGSYDESTGVLTEDSQLKVYQVVQGTYDLHGTGECDVEGTSNEKLFHFVRNDCIVSDNRIPPLGFTGGSDPETQPVAYAYPETSPGSGVLVNFDETSYSIPIPAWALLPVRVSARVMYQTASKDYVEFLRDQATEHSFADDCISRSTGPVLESRGQIVFDLWEAYGRSAPVDMGLALSGPLGDADTDGDGVSNSVELSGPNGGDGNDDFNPDFLQPAVVSLLDAGGSDYITLEVSGGCSVLHDVVITDEASMPAQDANFDYPMGLVAFRAPCAAATLKLWFHGAEILVPTYRKYGPSTPGDPGSAAWYPLSGALFGVEMAAGVSMATVVFSLVDGALGDDTGVDGQIIDAGGPGQRLVALPSISTLGLLLLVALLAVVTVSWLRSRESGRV